jgi:hypothetical protein
MAVARQTFQNFGFQRLGQGHVDGIDQLDRVLAPGIIAAPGDGMRRIWSSRRPRRAAMAGPWLRGHGRAAA